MKTKSSKLLFGLLILNVSTLFFSLIYAAEKQQYKETGSVSFSEWRRSISVIPQETERTDLFKILPSSVQVPQDVPLGLYRRIFQPFPNWTLICDENLKIRKKVCNVSQAFVDSNGKLVFSWSLASNKEGLPYFILRAPEVVKEAGNIILDIPDGGEPVIVAITDCAGKQCVAYLSVGPRLRRAVEKSFLIKINFLTGEYHDPVSISAPMEGLSLALEAI